MLIIEVFKNSINDFQNSMQISGNLFIEIRFSALFSILDFEINDSQIEVLRTQKFELLSKNSKLNSKGIYFFYTFFKIKYINLSK